MHTNRPAIDSGPFAVSTDTAEPCAHPLEIVVRDDPAALADVWMRLQDGTHNSLHQSYEWCRAWYDKSGQAPLVVYATQNGEPVFLLPLAVDRRYGIRIAAFPGGRHNNLNTGLFAETFRPGPDEQAEIARRMKRLLRGRTDLVALEAVPRIWRGRRHALADLEGTPHPNHSFQLPLYPRLEETLAQVNAKRRRKKFRTQTRRLEEVGGFNHYRPETAEEQHALLDLFFQQKRVRFRTHGLPDVFAHRDVQAFFHALIDVPRQGNDHPLMLHAIRLKAPGDNAIAAIAGLSRKGDHIICQFGSIDESRVPETSPGELLFWLMIEEACKTGGGLFDFGIGDQLYKRSWCPVETAQYDIMLPVSETGQLAALVHAGSVRAKAAIKRNPLLYRLLQRLRSTGDAASAPASDERD